MSAIRPAAVNKKSSGVDRPLFAAPLQRAGAGRSVVREFADRDPVSAPFARALSPCSSAGGPFLVFEKCPSRTPFLGRGQGSQLAGLTRLQPQPLDRPRLHRSFGNLHTQRVGICLSHYRNCCLPICCRDDPQGDHRIALFIYRRRDTHQKPVAHWPLQGLACDRNVHHRRCGRQSPGVFPYGFCELQPDVVARGEQRLAEDGRQHRAHCNEQCEDHGCFLSSP